MPLAFRHRDESAPSMPALRGFAVHRERNTAVMAGLQQRSESEIQARFEAGHRAYIATMNGAPAAWGWVATSAATIGELKASFSVSDKERYLWNFVTLPAFRGQGIYPRLLASIIDAEAADGERFWIAYAPENRASGAGIRKAGFALVAELSFDGKGVPGVKDIRAAGGQVASRLLGLPEIEEAVAPCWKCARRAGPGGASCMAGSCSCDYQQAEKAC